MKLLLLLLLLLGGFNAFAQQPRIDHDYKGVPLKKMEEASKAPEIYTIVEQMPRFPGCEDMEGDSRKKKECADKKLLAYIYENIRYPSEARRLGIEGMALVSFVVTHTGEISQVEILRNPGGGTGEEAQRVMEAMNDLPERWTPGRQAGKAVHVRYNLPVRFRLTPADKSEDRDAEITDEAEAPSEEDHPANSKIYTIVEQMPRFPGCEAIAGNAADKKACAAQKLLDYIDNNMQYPQAAFDNKMEGMAVIEFVITKKGKLANITIQRDPGAGLGAEAKRIVESMGELPEHWTPGYQNGAPVHVKYLLPVYFNIKEEKKRRRKKRS